jgi:hypothetical protein
MGSTIYELKGRQYVPSDLAYGFLAVVIPVVKANAWWNVRRMMLHVKSGPGFIREMQPCSVSVKNLYHLSLADI